MWIFLSLSAAVVWAINYLLAEKVLLKISALSFMAIEILIGGIIFTVFAIFQNLKADFITLGENTKTLTFLIGSVFTFVLGNTLIVTAIKESNATWAGLIEISYPLFIILFGWILFKEHHVNAGVIFGGIFIFFGIFTIYFFGQK